MIIAKELIAQRNFTEECVRPSFASFEKPGVSHADKE
jgi:hypothetical protein